MTVIPVLTLANPENRKDQQYSKYPRLSQCRFNTQNCFIFVRECLVHFRFRNSFVHTKTGIYLILVFLCNPFTSVFGQDSRNTESQSLARQFAEAYQQDWDNPSPVQEADRNSNLIRHNLAIDTFDAVESTGDPTTGVTQSEKVGPDWNRAVVPSLPQSQVIDISFSGRQEIMNSQSNVAGTQIGSIWWPQAVSSPFDTAHATEMVTVDSLLYSALRRSQQIQYISKDPLIRELEIVESQADFDPAMFARSIYDDRVDPVGNSLTTGGAPFLEDNIWTGEAGLRKKLRSGGQVEIGQKFGFQNSNSRFFVPQDQGTTTLSLNYNQPLLKGAGRMVNRSQILVAQRSTDLAWDTFSTQLQDELFLTVQGYWELYYRRSVFLQKQRNVERGVAILKKIEGRVGLDSLPSQVARARSEVQSRRTQLANAFRDVRNAETEIRRLISDPDWLAKQTVEMIPSEAPVTDTVKVPLKNVVYTALQNRPEIRATVQKAKLAGIQTDVLTNELLPDLTLLFSSYVSALEGDTGIERAFQQQFSATPGFSVGVQFEFPYQNRAARSRHTRSKIQMTKINHEIQQTTQNIVAEAQVAYRRLISALETLEAARLSVEAARIDLNQNHKRWENFALLEGDITEGQTPTLVLDQLLDSQQRLADAELTYSQAIKELKVSQTGLRRATGTLLMVNDVSITKGAYSDQPTIYLDRTNSSQPGNVFNMATGVQSTGQQTVPNQPVNQYQLPSHQSRQRDGSSEFEDSEFDDNQFQPDKTLSSKATMRLPFNNSAKSPELIYPDVD